MANGKSVDAYSSRLRELKPGVDGYFLESVKLRSAWDCAQG